MHAIFGYAHLVECMVGDYVNASTLINHNTLYTYIIDMDGDEKGWIKVIGLVWCDLFI